MSRRRDARPEVSGPDPGGVDAGDVLTAPVRRPNLSGDLEAVLVPGPSFRRRPRGYDRLQVDNYVDWAETALLSARLETDDLLDRYGRCWAELELARRALAHSPGGQEMAHVTERIGSMLKLAADEAAEISTTAAAEAARVRSEARADADAQRSRAFEVEQLALADADRLRRDADTDRAAAAAARQQAAHDVAELVERATEERERLDEDAARERARLDREAAESRDRLDREATERRDRAAAEAIERIRQQSEVARKEREAAEAAARDRLSRVDEEVADLERRREIARACLVRAISQVGEAVTTLAEDLPAPGLRLATPRDVAS